jgi:alpha,alpha-trehalose phosphorylase
VQRREPVLLPHLDYPDDPWRLIERRFTERHLARTETLFSVANGYLGCEATTRRAGRPRTMAR